MRGRAVHGLHSDVPHTTNNGVDAKDSVFGTGCALAPGNVPRELISNETLSRLDRHRVTTRVLLAAVVDRATRINDPELVSLVRRLARVDKEHGHLLEAVMEALAEEP